MGRPLHVKTLSFSFPRSVLVIVWHSRSCMFMCSYLLQNQWGALWGHNERKKNRSLTWRVRLREPGWHQNIFIITYNVLLSSLLPELLVIEWVISVASVRDLSPENAITHMKGYNFRKLISNNPGLLTEKKSGEHSKCLFISALMMRWWRHLSLYFIFFSLNLYLT